MKRIMAIVAAIVLLLTLSVNALAADGNVSYSGNAGEFVFEPGSEYSLTDLFPNFKDLMPGDTVTQRILLKNNADKRVNVRISMRALGAHHDSEAFLSQLQLKVTQVGKTDLFDAPANQTAQLSDWVLLGMLTTGGEVELEVSLTVPVTMGNEFQEQAGYLDWQFMVEETPSGYNPQTGDQAKLGLYAALMVSALVAIVIVIILLVRKKKKDEE
jgi:hypothetical protein